MAHGPHAAQDGYECGPTQNCEFTLNIMSIFVIMCHNVFNVWPKTSISLPVWPRETKGWTPLVQFCSLLSLCYHLLLVMYYLLRAGVIGLRLCSCARASAPQVRAEKRKRH